MPAAVRGKEKAGHSIYCSRSCVGKAVGKLRRRENGKEKVDSKCSEKDGQGGFQLEGEASRSHDRAIREKSVSSRISGEREDQEAGKSCPYVQQDAQEVM
jgi:hypothetical protein